MRNCDFCRSGNKGQKMKSEYRDNDVMIQTLFELMERWEDEIVEFKAKRGNIDDDQLGRYFSAISNEANLKDQQHGWLILGVQEKTHEIVGTNYKNGPSLQKMKHTISLNTTDGITFIEIYEIFPHVDGEKKRVLMFQIPAAATAMPTGWKNRCYGRDGDSLVPLTQEEIDRIRRQTRKDWSKQILPGAQMKHLNPDAIALARKNYKEKMNRTHISEDVDEMTDEEFLTKLKLAVDGKITNAAMLLLGNEDYDYLFDAVPELSWRLYDSQGNTKDYEIFKIPFITVGDRSLAKIRNLTYRYMPDQMTLFPMETMQYDPWMLHEILNNAIAHSQYNLGGRIYLNEFEDQLIITNPGTFLPGSVEPVLKPSYSPPFYRNQLLAETMVKFNMIDTQTMGIRKVYKILRDKYFPMPDYDLDTANEVRVTIYGKVLDESYTRVLHDHPEFDLTTIYLIDRVQKHKHLETEEVRYLRKLKVIEGKMPYIYVSANVAKSMEQKAQYIRNKGFDDEAYKKWIISYLETYGKGQKKDFIELLKDKLPDTMSERQKETKVKNLLYLMGKDGIITMDSQNHIKGYWILTDKRNS